MKLNKLVELITEDKINDIHVSLPAKIESYDAQKLKAKVTLLQKKELDGEKVTIPPIIECPVKVFRAGSFIIRPPYKKGDTVQVVFSESALDKILITGNPEDPQLKRKHSLDDAIVVGGLKPEQDADEPSENVTDLYIANKENKAKIVINENGDIIADNETTRAELIKDGDVTVDTNNNVNINCADATLTADKIYLGSGGASEGLSLGTSLKSWLDNHTHPYIWTDGGGSSNTSPPSSSSPSPSSKVMTE